MIVGFIGRMGSGKTLSMVRYAYIYYKAGYKILSNIALNFPYKTYTLTELIDYANTDIGMYKTIVLLDEGHIFLDSRSSGSKRNRVISYFLLQTRKKGCHLFYTTQRYHQIDKRLRDNSDVLVMCSTKVYKDEKKYTFNELNILLENSVKQKRVLFKSDKYFDLYNTYEVVKAV